MLNLLSKFTIILWVGVWLALLLLPSEVNAQSSGYDIEITTISIKQWPQVTVYFHIKNKQTGQRENIPLDTTKVKILEDGKDAKIIRVTQPGQSTSEVSVMLVMDSSGSMGESGKMASVIEAATLFVNLMQGNDRSALISFSDQASLLQSFTSDKTALLSKINRLSPGNGTNMFDAIKMGVELLSKESGRQLLIVLTDGVTSSGFSSASDVINAAKKNQIQIYTVGVGNGNLDENLLTDLANQTGGSYHPVRQADELSKLYTGISQGLHDEYSITYETPRSLNDGTTRPVAINLEGGSIQGGGKVSEPNFINFQNNILVFIPLLLLLLLMLLLPNLRRSRTRVMVQPSTPEISQPPYQPQNTGYRPDIQPPPPPVVVPPLQNVGLRLKIEYRNLSLPLKIGTNPETNLPLSSQLVEGNLNLLLEMQNGRAVIQDLGTSIPVELNYKGSGNNGVFVALRQSGALQPGSQIRVGNLQIQYNAPNSLELSANATAFNQLLLGAWPSDLPLRGVANSQLALNKLDATSFEVKLSGSSFQFRMLPGRPLITTAQARMIPGSEIILATGELLKLE